MKRSAQGCDEQTVMGTVRVAIALFAFMLFTGLTGCSGGHTDSSVDAPSPTVTSSQAATPTFSPTAGTYNSAQTVTISTSTPGCSGAIHWNTTGNPTSSDTQSTSVNVTSSETVYARVTGCPGHSDSAVGSAAYTINDCPSTTPCITTLIDDFNSYSDGNIGGTGDVTGGNWVRLDPAADPLVIVSHQVAPFSVGFAQSGWHLPFGPDYDFEIDLPVAPVAGYIVIHASLDIANKNGYEFVYAGSGSGGPTYSIVRLDANTPTALSSVSCSSHTLANGEKLWASKRGSTLSIYWGTSGGVYMMCTTATDGTYGTGSVGLQMVGETAARIDNLRGGTIPPPPPPPGSCSGSCPTFVQQATGADTHQLTVTEYDLPFANLVGPGNAVLGCVQWAAGASTLTVTDDKSNSYTLLTHLGSGNADDIGVFYKTNISNAPRTVHLKFSSNTNYVSAHATEFYNVGTATDGTATGANGSGSSIAAGSITTTADNDLIYQCANADGGGNPATWTSGGEPWTLLSGDGVSQQASQWQVQPAHGAVNPSMYISPTGSWNTQSVALKSAAAGSAPAPGIRVAGVTHGCWQSNAASVTYQIPATGNLLIANPQPAGQNLTTNCRVSSITDSAGNTWSQIGSDMNNGTAVTNQLYYAPNAKSSSNLTVTANTSCLNGDHSADVNILFLDVTGAATAPYDSAAGLATAKGFETSATTISGTSFTPTVPNTLVFSSVSVATNTVNAVSSGNFLSIPPIPDQQDFFTDQNNGFAVYYAPDTRAESYMWTSTQPVGLWSAFSAGFKGP